MRLMLEFNMPNEAIKSSEIRNILHNHFNCDNPMGAEELVVDFDMRETDCLQNLEKGFNQMIQQIGTSWETTFALVNPVGGPVIEGMKTDFIGAFTTSEELAEQNNSGQYGAFGFAIADFQAETGYTDSEFFDKKITYGHIGSDIHVTDESLTELERDLRILDPDLIVFDFWYHGTNICDL